MILTMSGTAIADLTVLGITYSRPIRVDRIISIAKSLVPEFWQPTTEVIEAACRRNILNGCLSRNAPENAAAQLTLTAPGIRRVADLLTHDPGELTQPSTLAMDAVQFCFLDFADSETKISVLSRHTQRLNQRLAQFEDRCRQCPHQGHFTRMWMDVERSRLDCMAQLLARISSEPATAFPKGVQ
jgi:hypothetical protein